MHLTYLGNLLLCVWSNPACFSKVDVRGLEIVQWALCVCVCWGERLCKEGGREEREDREEMRRWKEGEGTREE